MVRSRGLVSSDVSRRQAFRLVRRPVSSDLSSRQASRLVRPLVSSDAAARPTPRLAGWLFYSARLFVSNFLSATDSPSTRQNVSTQNRDMVQTTMLYFDGAPVLPHCWAPWSAAILAHRPPPRPAACPPPPPSRPRPRPPTPPPPPPPAPRGAYPPPPPPRPPPPFAKVLRFHERIGELARDHERERAAIEARRQRSASHSQALENVTRRYKPLGLQ